MKSFDRSLDRILSLARRAAPAPEDTVSEAEIQGFVARTLAAWTRQRPRRAADPDPLGLWERVGRWSLGTAAAVVFLAAVLRPQSPTLDAFGPLGPDGAEEVSWFEPMS